MAKRICVNLSDGEHWLNTPTPYAVERMEAEGVDPFDMPTQLVEIMDPETEKQAVGEDGNPLFEEQVVMGSHAVHVILSALLTDAEEVDNVTGRPVRIWTGVEAAKLIPWSEYRNVGEAIADLLGDMLQEITASQEGGQGNAPKVPQDHKAKKGTSRTRTATRASSSTASQSAGSSEEE